MSTLGGPGLMWLGVQRGLFLGRREGPGRLLTALLTKDEAQLLRRAQLRLVGTERRARLI